MKNDFLQWFDNSYYENPVISIKELIKWLEIEKLEEK